MPRITFISAGGIRQTVSGDIGQSVMEVAKRHGIDGIVGECGGHCACATCHVAVAPDWFGVTGPANADEDDMLDFTATKRQPTSRLACQIRVTPALDGLVVTTPERQR